MKFDLKKFKKISSNKTHTTLKHPAGHKIEIAHGALSSQMQKDLHSLPMMDDGGEVGKKNSGYGGPSYGRDPNQVKPANEEARKKIGEETGGNNDQGAWQNLKSGLGLADGGKIPGGDGSPYVDPKSAEQVSEGVDHPTTWSEGVQNLKAGLGLDKDKDSQQPQQKAKGGQIQKDPTQRHLLPGDALPNKIEKKEVSQAAKKMADGGDVAASDDQSSDQAPNNPQAPVTINIGGQPNMGGAAINPNPGAQAAAQNPAPQAAPPEQPYMVPQDQQAAAQQQAAPEALGTPAQAPQQAAPAAPQDPYGINAQQKVFSQGLGETKAGIQGQAQATAAEGQAQAAALHQQVANQQQNMADFHSNYAALDNERKGFQQDVQNQQIDPQHYLNSMDTGKRIATGIGLILGGIGGGILHQENPVLRMLNSQIDRDIDAQKANLGKKESLLNANLRQFGNMRDATDMTRLMSMDVISNKLKEAAAKAATPMAKANALQAAGKIDMDTAAIQGQMAMRKTLMGGMQAGRIAPESIIRAIVPQDQQKDAYKELKEAQDTVATRDNLLHAFDQVAGLQTAGSRVGSPIQSGKQIDTLKQPLLAAMSKGTAGRFTEADAKMLDPLWPKLSDNADTVAQKRQAMMSLIGEKMHFPQLKYYGIDPNKMGRFNNQGASNIRKYSPQ